MEKKFDSYYKYIEIPILVLRGPAVIYENRSAKHLLNPLISTQKWGENRKELLIGDLLKMPAAEDFFDMIRQMDYIEHYTTVIRNYYGEEVPVALAVSKLYIEEEEYRVLSIHEIKSGEQYSGTESAAVMTLLGMAHNYKDEDESIQNILAYLGELLKVDRAYIFESISDQMTSNTFEWCADGIEPQIDNLQQLSKDEYSYDDIISNGMMITDDVRLASEEDRAILEPQGIKALAIIPLNSNAGALGYAGFDDCTNYRKWTREEVKLLKEGASLLTTILVKRNTQRQLHNSMHILQTVTDHLNSMVCVSELHTNRILFFNNSMACELGLEDEDRKKELYFLDMRAVSKETYDRMMKEKKGSAAKEAVGKSWEFFEKDRERWYLVSVEEITWIDGNTVQILTATDITKLKEYETRLEFYASTDQLTGVYSREWGNEIVSKILKSNIDLENNSLVFIDLDGLKQVNDFYGHNEGDRMIKKTLELIRNHTRKSDILFRWGGDEFILVIRGNARQAGQAMRNVRKHLMLFNETKELPYKLGFSYGIAQLDCTKERTLDAILLVADQAMYEDKKNKHLR